MENWWRSTRTVSPAFPALQAALSNGRDETLVFYLFDLLYLDGWDLRKCALRDRKDRLKGLDTWHGMLRYSDHDEGDAARMLQAACEMKLEGIICKKADAPYTSGRGHDWLKVKCSGREEFLVIGWTEPAGSRTGLGALHLGYYDPQGRLHYAGGVGTGFSDETLMMLRDRLDGLGTAPPARPDGRRRGPGAHHPLGKAGTGGRDLLRRLVRCRPGAACRVPGLARGQGAEGCRARSRRPGGRTPRRHPEGLHWLRQKKGPIIAVPPKKNPTDRPQRGWQRHRHRQGATRPD